MVPKLVPIVGSWPGKLFLSSRPRGGDWLEDELSGWQRYGIDSVVSLLTTEEEQELGLVDEASEARKHDLAFLSYPISDRGIPSNPSTLDNLLETIHRDLEQGKNVLVHCRQGIGRTGLVAASLLVREGWSQNRPSRRFPKCEVFTFRRRPNKKIVFTELRRTSN